MPEGLSTIDMKTFNFSLNLAFESSVKYQLVIYYRVFERKYILKYRIVWESFFLLIKVTLMWLLSFRVS